MSPVAVVLTGPTACGKSSLAMALAEEIPLEIISADSAQVYRGMDIGSAKPSRDEQAAVPHHLLDIRDAADPYSAADFVADATRLIDEIRSRGRLPLLAGGTMLYLRALKQGIADLPEANPAIRERLLAEASELGWASLHGRLATVDPDAAARIRPSDTQRLQRALEVHEITGKTMTSLHKQGGTPFAGKLLEIAIMPPERARLHEKIAVRFRQMIADGLIDEVECFFERGDLTPELPAMRAVGYRQVWQYLAGELSRDAMVEKGIVATRQLAKRQYTWLRSWEGLQIVDAPELGDTLKILESASIFSS